MIFIVGEGDKEKMSEKLYNTLCDMGRDVIWVDQNSLPIDNTITFYPDSGKLSGYIYMEEDGLTIPIDDIEGIYTRLSRIRPGDHLEEGEKEIIQSERSIAIDLLYNYTNAIVINPTQAQRSNGSKIYQSYIVKQFGFKIPKCLISTDITMIKSFIEENKDTGVIYKSCSGQRSIVHKFEEEDFEKLAKTRNCPVLFQEFVVGKDIRVHALATGEIFATGITAESNDYRYDHERELKAIDIPDDIQKACVELTKALGLYLAGIDLRVSPEDEYYCFEANPSPVFTWYEQESGQPITQAVANMLVNGKEIVNSNIVKRIF